jgi:hypothetical protein
MEIFHAMRTESADHLEKHLQGSGTDVNADEI